MSNGSKVAIVTGASGALGAVVVQKLIAMGFNVAALDFMQDQRNPNLEDFNPRLLNIHADVTDISSCRNACDQTLRQFGRIDVLCNIAGGFRMGSSLSSDALQQWELLMEVNAGAVFKMVHCVAPHLLKNGGGSIVNVGAQSALSGKENMAAYCASKSAVIRLTESFAAEFKSQGVRVNCILPNIIDTPANRESMQGAEFSAWTSPERIADAVAFLVSEQSLAVNGASIAV
ncbi:SDR family NAD(P)-dependent oxidoreductase [Acidovorax sp. SRB_14]|uniref:SDR family NAD(P)-dependent oxidoreductase n=1 Tax=Acidovorax sp. SRB_14 TaxID=1962699 RepID=UPI001C20BA04|nr:SDR family NAD(P)-dependent oxidoreductase [Acidovorax sp. SRB_14]